MTKPTKLVIDCSTGIESIIELTDAEIAQREADALAFAETKVKEDADKTAKSEAKASALNKLKALGLTIDEINSLLG